MVDKSKIKILLVEDDEYLRDLYLEILQEEGYNVDVAINGEEGYNKLHKGGFDLVLLDIIMPKMDATQILKKLQQTPPEKKNKCIVFMTNLGQENIVKNGSVYGVSGYLIKSDLTPDVLLEKISRYLNS